LNWWFPDADKFDDLAVEIEGADKNGSVRFHLARQVFLACEFFDRLCVYSEHLHLALTVALEIVIEGPAD
jgi:hypothetical protein